MSNASRQQNRYRVGVISDTHGLLRPQAAEILQGSDLIIHAGDLGSHDILVALQRIAPVAAVRGNVDFGHWTQALPLTDAVEIGGVILYVLHDLAQLDLDPAAAGFAAVISGHSHRPAVENNGGVLYLNPGSAGPRRLTLPISLALLQIENGALEAKFYQLKP